MTISRVFTLYCASRHRTLGVLAAAAGLSAALIAPAAYAQNALDNILSAKEIKIAIPTDYPPYGFVGTDLKPRAWTWRWPNTSPPRWA